MSPLIPCVGRRALKVDRDEESVTLEIVLGRRAAHLATLRLTDEAARTLLEALRAVVEGKAA